MSPVIPVNKWFQLVIMSFGLPHFVTYFQLCFWKGQTGKRISARGWLSLVFSKLQGATSAFLQGTKTMTGNAVGNFMIAACFLEEQCRLEVIIVFIHTWGNAQDFLQALYKFHLKPSQARPICAVWQISSKLQFTIWQTENDLNLNFLMCTYHHQLTYGEKDTSWMSYTQSFIYSPL